MDQQALQQKIKPLVLHASTALPELLLAPMEGVTDWVMRDLLTLLGGIDLCVTEFLRVTDKLLPESVFYKNCPELKTASKTRAGTPVFIQLLGGQPEPMAQNALRAQELGAMGIDLNFGCPAKTVNRHDGGAAILKSSDRIFKIVKAVRQAVPESTLVTAKIRLGYDNPEQCLDNAVAVAEAGATWLTVHCRTKTDGYRPPAYWEWIPRIQEKTKIKIIANGEIWTTQDFKRCQDVTQCRAFMIGRGALRNPYLFQEIKNQNNLDALAAEKALKLVPGFYEACGVYVSDYFGVARTKQWLNQLRHRSQAIQNIFDQLKVIEKPVEFKTKMNELIS